MSEPTRRHSATDSYVASDDFGIRLDAVLGALSRGRRTLIIATSIGAVIGFGLALTKKASYTATFSFLPQTASAPSASGLASLAGQFGINVGALGGGGADSPQLYAELVRSREVLTPIIDEPLPVPGSTPVSVPRFFHIEG